MDDTGRTTELLEELVTWTRFLARSELEKTMRDVLKDDKHLLAYELSDGTRTQTQIAQAVGMGQPSISELWKRWRRLGLLISTAEGFRHLMRPSDIGMEVPSATKSPSRRSRARQTAEPTPSLPETSA